LVKLYVNANDSVLYVGYLRSTLPIGDLTEVRSTDLAYAYAKLDRSGNLPSTGLQEIANKSARDHKSNLEKLVYVDKWLRRPR